MSAPTRVGRAAFSSFSQDWNTPRAVYQTLDAEFGFTLDPCPNPGPNGGVDGLARSWAGEIVFLNPPYNAAERWMAKARAESQSATIVALVAARTDTRWWHDYAMTADEIRFIRGRLRFEQHPKRANGSGTAPFPSALVIWRAKRRTP